MLYINIIQDFWYYLENFQIINACKLVAAFPLFFLILLAVSLFALFYMYIMMSGIKKSTAYGDARFSTAFEIAKRLYKDVSDGIICGKFKKRCCVLKDKHMLLCAPTGSGKGVGTIIPTLLNYDGSVVVNDPKGECYYVTARKRKEMGHKVYMLAPFGHLFPQLCRKTYCYNPLELIDTSDSAAVLQSKILATTLIEGSSFNENDFWTLSPRRIVSVVIMHVCEKYKGSEKTLGKVRDILALETPDFIQVVQNDMKVSEIDYIKKGAQSILSAWSEGEGAKLFSSLTEVINTNTDFLDNEFVKHFFSKSDVELDKLLFEKISVFYVVDPNETAAAAKVGAIVFNDALRFLTKRTARVQRLKKNKQKVMFLIDEFPQLPYMPSFEKAMGIVRGFGGVMYLVIQDIAQLKNTYNKNWSTFFSNAASMYIGVQDLDTAKYVSEMLGNTTVRAKSVDSQRKVSFSEVAKPLRSVDELIAGGNDNTILFAGGMRATLMKPIIYHEDQQFIDDADENPFQAE